MTNSFTNIIRKKCLLKKQINFYDLFTLCEGAFLYYLSYLLLSYGQLILGAITYGYAIARFGLVMHMLIHNGVFSNYYANKILSYIYQNIFIGISVKWWRKRHNQHHNNTNLSTKDPDLLTYPMIVYNKNMPTSTLTIYQVYLLPLYLSVYIIVWRISSLIKCISMGWYRDILFTILHWIIFLSFVNQYSIFEILKFIYISNAIAGLYLGTVFMFNHFLEDVKDVKDEDTVAHVMKTTVNLKSNWLITYIFGGLNYQIEHHLFPSANVCNLHKINKIVREYPLYKEYTITESIYRTYQRLQEISVYAAENNPTFTEWVCEKFLSLMGWKILNKQIKIPKHCIILGYPHTSYFDFIVFNLYFKAIKCGSNNGLYFLISSKFNYPILSYFIRKLGGVFVNHKKSQIQDILSLKNNTDNFRLHIPPEGTTKKKDYLKTGFYVIGMKTKLPVMAFSLDNSTKCLDRNKPLVLTGNISKDMIYFQSFYENKTGINNNNKTPFELPANFVYKEE